MRIPKSVVVDSIKHTVITVLFFQYSKGQLKSKIKKESDFQQKKW